MTSLAGQMQRPASRSMWKSCLVKIRAPGMVSGTLAIRVRFGLGETARRGLAVPVGCVGHGLAQQS